ncbi:hypothetical protein ACI3ET_01170 [Ornithinimicrobium sp. LYQ121]|uniref:hypothetical protein n=1 Tax=Ornithinimicrobium sp. LYQ121 TaxID=3378801 RepID=UPI003851DB4C
MSHRLVHGLRVAASWHGLLLHNSPWYRHGCQVLGHYLMTGRWDLDPPEEDLPY